MSSETGLTTLLENLREEIDRWELTPGDLDHESETIRYGLYLIAMDILWCEVMTGGGYQDYLALQTSAKLPENDYQTFATQLTPYIVWLRQANLNKLLEFKETGMSDLQAQDELLAGHLTACQNWLKTKPTNL